MTHKSLFSGFKGLEDFEKLSEAQFDVQTWKEFQAEIQKGTLSLPHDSLGELLGIANFFGKDDNVEYSLDNQFETDEEYHTTIKFIQQQFGVDIQRQQAFFVQDLENLEEFTTFVQQWYDAQGKRKRWNPGYARPVPQPKIYDLTNSNPKRWLNKLSLPYDYVKYERAISSPPIDFYKEPRTLTSF